MFEKKVNNNFLKRCWYEIERNLGTIMRNPIGSQTRPKRIKIICFITVMVSSILFIIFTQLRKSSAYDSNLTLVILEIKGMQWNSCSLTYNLTILTKLSLYHKKKNTQNHVYGFDAIAFHSALYFFLFSLTPYSLSYSYVEILNVTWGFFVGPTNVIPN